MKICPKCNRVLPDDMFAPHSRICKLCRRDYDWQYRYGISPEQYFELWDKQEGKCAICGKKLVDGDYLHVDHNQHTGEVRGLLCRECNLGLGNFKDSISNLEQAIKYLKDDKE